MNLTLTPADRKAIARQNVSDSGIGGNTLYELLSCAPFSTWWQWEGGETLTFTVDQSTVEAIYLIMQDADFELGIPPTLVGKLEALYHSPQFMEAHPGF